MVSTHDVHNVATTIKLKFTLSVSAPVILNKDFTINHVLEQLHYVNFNHVCALMELHCLLEPLRDLKHMNTHQMKTVITQMKAAASKAAPITRHYKWMMSAEKIKTAQYTSMTTKEV